MSFQTIFDIQQSMTVNNRRMVGQQVARSGYITVAQYLTAVPWVFTIQPHAYLYYPQVRAIIQAIDNKDRQLSETIVMSEEELKQIQHPVLLGIGDRDTTSSLNETIKVYKLLSNSRLWVVPNAAHPFEKINPERIAAEIRYFFISA